MTNPPIGWPGTARQWLAKLGEIRAEYTAMVSDLRGHGYDVPKSDRAREESYVSRRVLELVRWNGWSLGA